MKKLFTSFALILMSYSITVGQCSNPVSNINENFDSVADYEPHPNCWTVHNQTGLGNTYIMPNIAYSYSGTKSLRIGNAAGPGTDIMYVVLPMLTHVSGELSFYAKAGASSILEIGTMSGQNDTASFTLVQPVVLNSTYQLFTINNMSGTDQFIAFRYNVNNNWMVLDDVVYDSAVVVVPDLCDTTVNALNEDFEPYNFSSMPDCWTNHVSNMSGSIYVLDHASYSVSGTKSLRMGHSTFSGTSTLFVVSPKMQSLNGILRFQASTNGLAPLVIGTMPTASDTASFTAFDIISHTNVYQEFIVDFAGYVGTDSFIVFKYDMPNGNWTVLDDINYSIGTPIQNIYKSTNLAIYPNPTNSTINIDNEEIIESIRIYNLNGQLVKFVTQSQKNIDIQDLQKGFYIIETQTPNGIFQNKITKL